MVVWIEYMEDFTLIVENSWMQADTWKEVQTEFISLQISPNDKARWTNRGF
jgi:hypothetical protein